MKNIPEMNDSTSYTIMWTYLSHRNVHLKMVKMVNFVMYVTILKNKKG